MVLLCSSHVLSRRRLRIVVVMLCRLNICVLACLPKHFEFRIIGRKNEIRIAQPARGALFKLICNRQISFQRKMCFIAYVQHRPAGMVAVDSMRCCSSPVSSMWRSTVPEALQHNQIAHTSLRSRFAKNVCRRIKLLLTCVRTERWRMRGKSTALVSKFDSHKFISLAQVVATMTSTKW